MMSVAIAFSICGEIGGHKFTLTKAKPLFRRYNLWHTKDGIWKQVSIFPFGCSIFGIVLNIWLKMKSCSFNLHIMLPAQLTPSPEYPDLQVHEKERSVLVQYASSWQLCCPVLHSSTNQQVKVSYKNSLELNVFTCICITCIMTSWLIFIEKTLVPILRTKVLHLKACYRIYGVAGLHRCYAREIWPLVISISRAFGRRHQRGIIFRATSGIASFSFPPWTFSLPELRCY